MQEALSGLPGIASVEADLKKDLLRVRYDSAMVTPEHMLKLIDDEGFVGKLVPSSGSAGPP